MRFGGRASPFSSAGVLTGATLLGTLVVWQAAAYVVDVDAFPSATQAIADLPTLLLDPEALVSIAHSLLRMIAGYGLACLLAIPLGLTMARSRTVETCVNPILMAFYPVPKAALMPLLMLWIGVGDASKILVIFLGASLPLIYHAFQGGRAIDDKLIWSARAMGMGARRCLFRIVLPSALPHITLGARTAFSMALIVMVSVEMISRENGIGDILFNSLDMAIYPTVYAAIIVIAAIGFLSDWIIVRAQARFLRWAEPIGSVLPQA